MPSPDDFAEASERDAAERALAYMGLQAGTPMREVAVDTVFIGSCTNGRIEDLRAVAAVAEGRQVADGVRTLVVPGSGRVKDQAEAEGLDAVLTAAGFDWRQPGCSMCLAMNPDKLAPASGRRPPATATSRAARAVAAAPTSCPPPSPPPPPSPAPLPPPTTWS